MLAKYYDTMAKRDPFDGLWKTFESLNSQDLFGDLFSDFKHLNTETRTSRVEQTDTEMIASFDLPGVKPGEVEINVVDQALTITYTLRGKKQTQQYTIRNDYDASAAVAKMEHGVLELRLPRISKTKGKKINIEVK